MSYPSQEDARRAVLLPETQSQRDLQRVYERGYLAWKDGDELHGPALINEIERFTLHALSPDTNLEAEQPETPLVEQPAAMAVVSTLGAVAILEHDALTDTPRENLEVFANVRDLYVQTAQAYVFADEAATLLQELAEQLFAKPASEDGPHPGRVCTGVTQLDDGHYAEIPLPAASPACVARATKETVTGGYDAESQTATGEVVSRLQNNAVYVPVSHVLETHREHLAEQFDRLVRAHEDMLSAEQRQWLSNEADGISDRINRFLESGQRDLVWSDWNPDKRVVRVLRSVLLNTGLELETAYTASELYGATETYEPGHSWESDILARFGNHVHLERKLRDLAEQDIGVDVEPFPEGVPDQFLIHQSGWSTNELQVEAIEDLFELPCFAAMDERLQEKGPVRKDLYNFARLVMWLPGYREMGLDELVAEFHDVFDRWPWYDSAETEYQIRYEFDNEVDGETPLPMNCENPDMQRYCIGREECPYSIYGSLPFPEEMYDQLE